MDSEAAQFTLCTRHVYIRRSNNCWQWWWMRSERGNEWEWKSMVEFYCQCLYEKCEFLQFLKFSLTWDSTLILATCLLQLRSTCNDFSKWPPWMATLRIKLRGESLSQRFLMITCTAASFANKNLICCVYTNVRTCLKEDCRRAITPCSSHM